MSSPREQFASTPTVSDGPHCQPSTVSLRAKAIRGPKARATAITWAHVAVPSTMTTRNAPSGPPASPQRLPAMVGDCRDAGIDVAGGSRGPATVVASSRSGAAEGAPGASVVVAALVAGAAAVEVAGADAVESSPHALSASAPPPTAATSPTRVAVRIAR